MRDSCGDHHTQSTKQEREKDMISGEGRGCEQHRKERPRRPFRVISFLLRSPLAHSGSVDSTLGPGCQPCSWILFNPPILPPSILSPKLPPSLPLGLALVPGKCYSPREGSWRAQREGTFDSDAQKRSSSCKEYPEAAAVAPGGGGRVSPRHHFDSAYSQAMGNQTWPPASLLTPYAGTLEPWTPHHKGLTHTTGADTIRHTRMDMAGQGTTDIPSCPEQVVDPTVNGEGSCFQKKGSFSRELSPRHSLPCASHDQVRSESLEPLREDPTNTEAIQIMAQRKRSPHPWDRQTVTSAVTEMWR